MRIRSSSSDVLLSQRHVTESLEPDVYAHWRKTPLGAMVEQVESRLVFEFAGPLAGKRLLDVGTGDGQYAIEAAVRGADVTAMDSSAAMLRAADVRAKHRGVALALHEGDVRVLPYEDRRFDIVLAVTALCMVGNSAQPFREMARVLAPGGLLVIGELGRWSLWAAKRRLESIGRNTIWDSMHFWAPGELRQHCTEAGLVVQGVRGAVYFPPLAALARVMAPLDRSLARISPLGAAFLCVVARKPVSP